MTDPEDRRSRALEAFRAANAADPNTVLDRGQPRPKELVDAERLATWVERLEPSASEALLLASHCQHLCRWQLPRTEFADGRIGYLTWRKALARLHADRASEILREAGYGEDVIEQVRSINLKQGLRTNPDVQAMEDALCLAFLEYELDEFADKHPDDKLIDIIRKTWGKMSERAHARALELPLSSRSSSLVSRALGAD
jgi:hypothetical protein